ncbi:MAG: heavy-metal-associated domain-containing protein [Thermodesulfobacteriota bacterium]
MHKIKVKGMSCMHCVNTVKTAVENVEGVDSAEVNLEKEEAKYSGNDKIDHDAVKKAVSDAGYTPE